MVTMTRPQLLVSADWSSNEKKRWMVRAELANSLYHIYPPEPVGDVKDLIGRLRTQVGSAGSALVGFDFPIGLPQKYAEKACFTSFRQALSTIGRGEWSRFYDISDKPSLRQPFAPLPKKKGQKGFSRNHIAKSLGLQTYKDLLRRCDKKTSRRSDAEILFFTLGGKQVGAGACVGWRDVLTPSVCDPSHSQLAHLWPFDGALEKLLSRPGVTICETYPGEAYHHLNISIGSGTGRSKTRRDDRKEVCKAIPSKEKDSYTFTNAALSWMRYGFLDEDDFDAMVALLSMIKVVTGQREPGVEQNSEGAGVEGWILGLNAPMNNVDDSGNDLPKA